MDRESLKGPLRILMLAPPPHLRGPLPKHTPHLVAALRALGCEVALEQWGRHQDVESIWDKVVGRIGDIWRVRGALTRTRPDVVVVKTSHDWNTVLRDVLLLLATRGRRPCTVLQLHGSQPETLRSRSRLLFTLMSRGMLRLSDAVLVLSSEEEREWRRVWPDGSIHRVANPFAHGHERDLGRPALPSRVLDRLRPDAPVLLFVGRLMREKGILDIVHALATLGDESRAQLLAVGEGPLAGEVARLARSLGLEDRVILAGYLQGEELDAAYAAASVFVLPTWWFEGFPTVIAEAMYARLPLVTTAMRGMADHLCQGTNALFVHPGQPGELANALRQLLLDPSMRAAMGAANRAAVQVFSPERVGEAYLAILRSVVEKCIDVRP